MTKLWLGFCVLTVALNNAMAYMSEEMMDEYLEQKKLTNFPLPFNDGPAFMEEFWAKDNDDVTFFSPEVCVQGFSTVEWSIRHEGLGVDTVSCEKKECFHMETFNQVACSVSCVGTIEQNPTCEDSWDAINVYEWNEGEYGPGHMNDDRYLIGIQTFYSMEDKRRAITSCYPHYMKDVKADLAPVGAASLEQRHHRLPEAGNMMDHHQAGTRSSPMQAAMLVGALVVGFVAGMLVTKARDVSSFTQIP